jgi:hypothetical protein
VTVKGTFKVGDISVDKLELAADKLNLEFSTLLQGVKVSVKGSDAARSAGADGISCNVGLDYANKDYNLSLDTSLLKEPGLTSVSGVFNVSKGFTLGGQVTVSPSTITAPSAYNASLAYKGEGYSFGVQTEKKFKALAVGFHASASSDVTVGASIKLPTPVYGGEGASVVEAGLTYKASKEATVHAKVSKAGKVSLAFAHVLSPLATLTLATELDASNISSDDHKFGLLLAIKA